ncbi:MAG: hypothetical protein WA941_20280 [Nitrososphaeraceae archaeon]
MLSTKPSRFNRFSNESFSVEAGLYNCPSLYKDINLEICAEVRGWFARPNERKVNQQIKSRLCANRFYEDIQDQKDAISHFLDNKFGRGNDDRHYDT